MKDIPTGVEIIQKHSLKDQIMVEIPKTSYHLHGLKKENGRWNISLINQTGGCKRNIMENITNQDFKNLIVMVLANKDQTEFKKEPKLIWLARHYKSIIKSHKA
jgi:hypothetical protein